MELIKFQKQLIIFQLIGIRIILDQLSINYVGIKEKILKIDLKHLPNLSYYRLQNNKENTLGLLHLIIENLQKYLKQHLIIYLRYFREKILHLLELEIKLPYKINNNNNNNNIIN